jgi:IS4 transposase
LIRSALPAAELAAVYHKRWQIEMGYDEIKNHLKEPGECLRSKPTELVIQEFYGYLLTHFTIR